MKIEYGWASDIGRKKISNRVLTQCLGINQDIYVHKRYGRVKLDDMFILCSDGLYNKIPPAFLVNHLTAGNRTSRPLQTVTEELLNEANENGGEDNITIIVLQTAPEGTGLFNKIRWAFC